MSEREKVIAVKYVDHQAFVELYNDYWGQVYDFSRLYISRVADAEEIVQDVFVKLWESRHLLKEDESFKGFLFIITRNIVFSRNRKKVNENLFKTSVLSAFGNESNYNSNSVEEEYCASQLAVFIDKLIGSLPEQQKRCFLLSREENLSYKEIAERLGISPKTVEIHMGKALKFLKNSIERGWEILLSLLSF
ncbi:RNA polymerase sigma-70 factor [Phocaeicola sartorii]|uniref:RNA polymerase sigma-70 factor n=1 Tax=Phocaeicola sartorii TaxID=671267 RepID=UPI0013645278|nr:RNA polymerase sigma-70 factor [Phocaeicola sartorii]NBH67760.1 RNA polymerase sigma-70 factor [Phocaeicola sartorii]